jgi:pimeloyl-ACP methyl ester carboxylesterase
MNKAQAQLQKLLESLPPEYWDNLIKDLLDSAVSSAKGAASHVNMDRTKFEALSREALESMDRAKLEKWLREAIHSVDTDKLEKWARTTIRSIDADKLKRILREQLAGVDRDKLESMLKEGIRHIDRSRLESNLRRRIRNIDLQKLKGAAATLSTLAELDPQKIEEFVNTRVDNVVRARLDALSAEELELMAAGKRAVQSTARKGKSKLSRQERKLARQEGKLAKQAEEKHGNPLARLLGFTGRAAFFGAAGWIAYSHLFLEHQVPLPKAIAAELLTLVYRPSGPINIYQDGAGNGRPIVFVHSVNAAASSYEMRPLFQHYRGQRPVFALDLPGFGFSARPDIEYTPDVYVNAIITMLAGVTTEPADVVALSLSSEFVAEAARRRPDLFHSLVLISPSGMQQRDSSKGMVSTGNSGMDAWVYPLLSFRLWSRPFYDLLTTRRSIAYFLQKSFVGNIPDGMVDYSISTSHQPGAEHAPLYFVSGKLFTPNAIERIYRQVNTPTLVVYDQDGYVSFERLPELLATNKAWQATRVSPTLGLPQWEKLEETTQVIENFWQSVKEPAPVA